MKIKAYNLKEKKMDDLEVEEVKLIRGKKFAMGKFPSGQKGSKIVPKDFEK